MSAILSFYRGGADIHGRRLDTILAWDDARLEAVHDFIQWLFPLPEPSAFNPDAPLLMQGDIEAFRGDPALRQRMRAALARMRRFYGWADGGAPFAEAHWLTPGNHNFLRLTRILRCLSLCGLDAEARTLLADLEALARGPAGQTIGARALSFWRGAVRC